MKKYSLICLMVLFTSCASGTPKLIEFNFLEDMQLIKDFDSEKNISSDEDEKNKRRPK